MNLLSPNLTITPLSVQQIMVFAHPVFALEDTLQAQRTLRIMSERTTQAFAARMIPSMMKHPKYEMYYTIWSIRNTAQSLMVADICFKGPPNEHGEVELAIPLIRLFRARDI